MRSHTPPWRHASAMVPGRRAAAVNPFASVAAAGPSDADRRPRLNRGAVAAALALFLLLAAFRGGRRGTQPVQERQPRPGAAAAKPGPPRQQAPAAAPALPGSGPAAAPASAVTVTVLLGADGTLGARWLGGTTVLAGVREGGAMHRAGGQKVVGMRATHVNGIRVASRAELLRHLGVRRRLAIEFAPVAPPTQPPAAAPLAAGAAAASAAPASPAHRKQPGPEYGDNATRPAPPAPDEPEAGAADPPHAVTFVDSDGERARFRARHGALWYHRERGKPPLRVERLRWHPATRELQAAGWRMQPRDAGPPLQRLLRRMRALAESVGVPHDLPPPPAADPAPAERAAATAAPSPADGKRPAECPPCACPLSGGSCAALRVAVEDQRQLAAQRERELNHCRALVEERATPAPTPAPTTEEESALLPLPDGIRRVSIHIGGSGPSEPTDPSAAVILVSTSSAAAAAAGGERTVLVSAAVGATAGFVPARWGVAVLLPLAALLSTVKKDVAIEHVAFDGHRRKHALAALASPGSAAALQRVGLVTLELLNGVPAGGLPSLEQSGFLPPQVCWRNPPRRCLSVSAVPRCLDCSGPADATWQRR
eukprot:TRINITY_DN72157_c0_g1_i1.p1 TRINITY_DN72157_c0_g1~~TRINITY_DN72157_c0_g1_i1.p1  ORF type:complete len:598 (+),score=137.99 TRINITY_DN72157_c0_g1_i1:71-1864(+)